MGCIQKEDNFQTWTFVFNILLISSFRSIIGVIFLNKSKSPFPFTFILNTSNYSFSNLVHWIIRSNWAIQSKCFIFIKMLVKILWMNPQRIIGIATDDVIYFNAWWQISIDSKVGGCFKNSIYLIAGSNCSILTRDRAGPGPRPGLFCIRVQAIVYDVHAVEKLFGWEMELNHHGKSQDRSTTYCATIQPDDELFIYIYILSANADTTQAQAFFDLPEFILGLGFSWLKAQINKSNPDPGTCPGISKISISNTYKFCSPLHFQYNSRAILEG